MSSTAESLRQRKLEIAKEIAHAFLTADHAIEVYRLALARVVPLVRASFASVFLRDDADPDLLRLVCAQSWPQASARFLSDLRIRVGRGPTGRAVAEGRAVEVRDVFSDPALREWWEPARELGFVSLLAFPLMAGDTVGGALTFYFDAPHAPDEEERDLLSLIAAQLGATAEKAHLIEDLRRANERLALRNRELGERVRDAEQARRLKTEFLANMSHEFRTPLTAILGYAHLLRTETDAELGEGDLDAIAKIEGAAHALRGLVDDLLALSELKLGRVELQRTDEDAGALLRQAAKLAGEPADGVEFRLELPEAPLALRTDGGKVVTILEKLLGNAFKFTAEGEIHARVRDTGEHVHGGAGGAGGIEWSIADTGVGIPEGELDAIFDEFRQVDGSSTRLYGGTGLGLALSRQLARVLGGDLRVESVPGEGSTFTLCLPRDAGRRFSGGSGGATEGE
ncbi:MAG: ATP-binding protein [Gemmatimonadota bacterium]